MKKSPDPRKDRKHPKSATKVLSGKLGGPEVLTPDPDHGGGGGEDPVDYNPHPVVPKGGAN